MASNIPRALIEISYYAAAQEYLRNLPLEHFMEATPQGTQREITLESLALVKARRPDVHVFNELLVQYPRPGERLPGQVVPDNMVVLWQGPIKAEGSYDIPLQPVGPFWVLEYVSKSSKRKDYEYNLQRYEQELRVPYFLLFYPETQDLTLFRHTGEKYASVPANEFDRHPIPELELEVAILDGWVRYWFRGDLLPLPAELLHELDRMKAQLAKSELQAEHERQRAEHERQRAEHERQRAEAAERELESLRAQLRQLQTPPPS